MLLFAILGAVLLIAGMGFVMLMSGANDSHGRAVIDRPAGAVNRRSSK